MPVHMIKPELEVLAAVVISVPGSTKHNSLRTMPKIYTLYLHQRELQIKPKRTGFTASISYLTTQSVPDSLPKSVVQFNAITVSLVMNIYSETLWLQICMFL